MSAYVVWIEMDRAKVFRIEQGEKHPVIMRRREIKHHTSRDPENHKNSEKFFHDIASEIAGAKEVLLVGPGLAKQHFSAHLKRHHHTLAKAIVGLETSHHLSDDRLLELSRDFFKIFDVFGPSSPASA
jgi:stalled ribosome rescue protein Dom34